MFLPGRNAEAEKEQERQAFARIEQWAASLIPAGPSRDDAQISVQQVQCGDPNCAPIDTLVSIHFSSGGQGIFGMPMEAQDVTLDELRHFFPDVETLTKWHAGQEADWPPQPPQPSPSDLRFCVGMHVQCKISPTDWMPGTIVELWYREEGWPVGSYAPYKIHLCDGREIFAPADLDQVIQLDSSKEQENAALLVANNNNNAAATVAMAAAAANNNPPNGPEENGTTASPAGMSPPQAEGTSAETAPS